MPRSHPPYPPEFRRQMVELVRTGRTPGDLAQGNPVNSLDAKKKELVGAFRNAGRELWPKGEPKNMQAHYFIDRELGKANPYGSTTSMPTGAG